MVVSEYNNGRAIPESFNRVICFDIDGTLADTSHRQHFLDQSEPDWPSFFKGALTDPPITQMVYLNQMMGKDPSTLILLTTGREHDKSRDVTFPWLKTAGVVWHEIYFRAPQDYRPDYEVKQEMLDVIESRYKMKPFMVFDDRKSVVEKCWVKRGIYCCDVGNGRGDF